MIWEDILTGRWVGDAEIVHALASVFGVSHEDVRVADSPQAFDFAEPIQVLVERQPRRGAFAAWLEIVLRTPGPEQIAREMGSLEVVKQLSRAWRCDCLTSGESSNPYEWILIQPTGKVQIVHLDAERLDEHEEYVIRAYGSLVRRKPKLRKAG